MRPIIRLLAAVVAAAATIPSCSTLTGYPTDAEASYAKAIELTKKSVDTDKFKSTRFRSWRENRSPTTCSS